MAFQSAAGLSWQGIQKAQMRSKHRMGNGVFMAVALGSRDLMRASRTEMLDGGTIKLWHARGGGEHERSG